MPVSTAKTMDVTEADALHPNLRIANARPEPVAGLALVLINLVETALDIDGRERALVIRLEM